MCLIFAFRTPKGTELEIFANTETEARTIGSARLKAWNHQKMCLPQDLILRWTRPYKRSRTVRGATR